MALTRAQTIAAATVAGLIGLSAVAYAAGQADLASSPAAIAPATTPIVEERTVVETEVVHRTKHRPAKSQSKAASASQGNAGSAAVNSSGQRAASSQAPAPAQSTAPSRGSSDDDDRYDDSDDRYEDSYEDSDDHGEDRDDHGEDRDDHGEDDHGDSDDHGEDD